jgi:hypothetical protein
LYKVLKVVRYESKMTMNVRLAEFSLWVADHRPDPEAVFDSVQLLQFMLKAGIEKKDCALMQVAQCAQAGQSSLLTAANTITSKEQLITGTSSLDVNVKEVSIRQIMERTWAQAESHLRSAEASTNQCSAFLEKTAVRIEMKSEHQLYLKYVSTLKILLGSQDDKGWRLLADFKDIQLLFRYYQIYENVIQPVIEGVLSKLAPLVTEKVEEM